MNINHPSIILREGWFWPIEDTVSWDYIQERKDNPYKIAEFCKTKNNVIQAGGNLGYYPKRFAELFKNVYTFEPDYLNFNCLVMNTLENENIFRYQAGLGDIRKPFSLQIDRSNCGSYNMGKSITDGNIPQLQIDDLGIKDVSLIQLDVEGYEENCIRGGLKTIEEFKPIIVVETAWANPESFLNIIGYYSIGRVDVDTIFQYKKS